MNKKAAKALRLSLEWGAMVACAIAILQGGAGLPTSATIVLVVLGGLAGTVAELEHGWFRAPHWFGWPVRFAVVNGPIWVMMICVAWYSLPRLAVSADAVTSFHAPAAVGHARILYFDPVRNFITPVRLLSEIRITNETGDAVLIASYDVEAKDSQSKWRHLSHLNGWAGQTYICTDTTMDCKLVEQGANMDAILYEVPISPHTPVIGWVSFRDEWPSQGNRLADLRVIVTDTKGRQAISAINTGENRDFENMQGGRLVLAPGFFDLSDKRYIEPDSPLPR